MNTDSCTQSWYPAAEWRVPLLHTGSEARISKYRSRFQVFGRVIFSRYPGVLASASAYLKSRPAFAKPLLLLKMYKFR